MLSHSWPCHRTCTWIQGSSTVFGTEERKMWCNNRNTSWHFTECLLYMRPFMAGWCHLVLVRVLEGCHYPHLRVVARRRSITHPRSQRYWVAGLGSDATTCTLNHHSERLTCSVLTFPHQHHGPAWAHSFRPAGAKDQLSLSILDFSTAASWARHMPTPSSSSPTCYVDHDAADLGYAAGFHFARVVAVVLHRGHHWVHGLVAVPAVCYNRLVLLDYDFRKWLGQVRHLNGALDVEIISFYDRSLGADVELGIREGFYKKRTSWLDSGSNLGEGERHFLPFSVLFHTNHSFSLLIKKIQPFLSKTLV